MDEFHLADREPVKLAIEAAAKAESITQLYEAIRNYQGHELAQSQPYAPSQMCPHPNPIMIITEKPEPEDIIEGRPLSGDFGQILRNSLLELGIRQEDCHVTYAVHWTPEDEKSHNNTQFSASRPFLYREIELIQPRAILALGKGVMNVLTNYRGQITPLLGQTVQFKRKNQKLDAYITWHPAFVYRFPMKLSEYLDQLRSFFERFGDKFEETLPGAAIPRNNTPQPTGLQGIFKAAA